MKPHEKRDLAALVFDRTCETIRLATNVYAPSPRSLGVAGNAAMRAGLLAIYTGAKLECSSPFTIETLLTDWVKTTLPTPKDFDADFLAEFERIRK